MVIILMEDERYDIGAARARQSKVMGEGFRDVLLPTPTFIVKTGGCCKRLIRSMKTSFKD